MSAGLADGDVRARIAGAGPAGVTETLFVEAGAGSGKTRALVDRVEALVDAGVDVAGIAAITFTEKAAAELRERIRARLIGRAVAGDAGEAERWRRSVDAVDGAPIGTLHAFAQRILTERSVEAELPPNVAVLDEVASTVAFQDRWRTLRASLLDDPEQERTLLLALAAGMKLDDLRSLARAFDDNWDLVAARVDRDPPEPPTVDAAGVLERLDAAAAWRAHCADPDDKLCRRLDALADYAQRLRGCADEQERLALLQTPPASFKAGNIGKSANWAGHAGEVRAVIASAGQARDEAVEAVVEACLRRLAGTVAGHTLAGVAQRRAAGRLAFHDLLVLARQLLRGPHGDEVRTALRQRYRRVLLDEFQDTDPIQVELAALLASPPTPDDAATGWPDLACDAGRLFFVGDPKQSIYRFRRADIRLFLTARDVYGPARTLTTNFRSAPAVLAWVNRTFGALIQPAEGSQPAYQPLDAAPGRHDPPRGPGVLLLGAAAHPTGVDAEGVRDAEAAEVADAISAAVLDRWQVRDDALPGGWRDARLGDIAVLLPARTSLATLERTLDERGIAYRAEASSLVYATAEVRDLFAAVRAVADPTDELSVVTALRSPLFGCGDDDLVVYRRRHRGSWDLRAPQPPDLPDEHPVAAGLARLRELHEQVHWLAPSELLDRLIRDCRLMELGLAHGRPRDLWRRLRFVVDQARAWSESEGGTLREYLAWAQLQATEASHVAEAVLPETDDDAVRIMTVHAAKGLEFAVTIVSGLAGKPGGGRGVQVSWPADGGVAFKLRADLATASYEAFKPIDEQLGHHERIRLLYVACTRAADHLVVSLHRKARARPWSDARTATNAELLADACAVDGRPAPEVSPAAGGGPVPAAAISDAAALPAFDDWRAEREQVLAGAIRPRSVAATAVAGLDADVADPGLAKEPRDLELPPWLKGRYGTGIGRAVHAVLQTVDLGSGAGLAAAAAAQAAAEALPGRDAEIASLARAALAAPTVAAATTRPRWRETYVAAPVAGVTLEGYVDLLYRSPDGLVLVDYKTAGADADLAARAHGYRLQGAAYALAVTAATGEAVARVVFVFLTAAGAVEHELDDLDAAMADVEHLLARDPAAASVLTRTSPPQTH